MRRALAIVVMAALSVTSMARADGLRVNEPRAFGYFVGDLVERRAEIDGPPGETLVAASLPRPGPSNYWLELRNIETTSEAAGGGSRHTLALTYQSFYVPLDPRKVTIPATVIQLKAGDATRSVTIPSFDFVMSPVREVFPASSTEKEESFLRPDAASGLVPTGQLRTASLAFGGLATLLLLLLARHMAWWPFHRRAARPFAQAARTIGTELERAQSGEHYKHALLALHRAFDATAGRRLLAGDLDTFTKRHPVHAGSRGDIQRLFVSSRHVFFADDEEAGRSAVPPHDLRHLAQTLAREERAAR